MQQPGSPATDVTPTEEELRACCAADAWLARIQAARPLPIGEGAARPLRRRPCSPSTTRRSTRRSPPMPGSASAGSAATTEDRWSRTEQAGALGAEADRRRAARRGQPRLRGAVRPRVPDPRRRPHGRGDARRADRAAAATTRRPSGTSYAASSPRSCGSDCCKAGDEPVSLSSHVLDAVRGVPAQRRADPLGALARGRLAARRRRRHRRRRPGARLGPARRPPRACTGWCSTPAATSPARA